MLMKQRVGYLSRRPLRTGNGPTYLPESRKKESALRPGGTALVALALIVSACGAPTGATSTDSSRLATTTTTTLVDPPTTSSSSVASGGDQPDFSEPTAFRAAPQVTLENANAR